MPPSALVLSIAFGAIYHHLIVAWDCCCHCHCYCGLLLVVITFLLLSLSFDCFSASKNRNEKSYWVHVDLIVHLQLAFCPIITYMTYIPPR